jgi:nitrite reductase/ring-hydroxylating ferredoxin subunit
VRYVVGLVSEIPPGARKIVEAGRRSIGVFNVDGSFYAIRNRCPHQGGPLCEGRLVGELESDEPGDFRYREPATILMCPWHRWEFDVRTGQSWCEPERQRVRAYAVEIEDPGPAETYPVTVDERYVVVEVPD